MRLIVASLLLAVASGSAPAQGGLRAAGHVRDSTGAPIAGATITTADNRTETDSLGKFSMRLARTESTTVTVRRMGFELVTFTMATDSLALNDLDIQLESVARALPGVLVQGERIGRVPTIERFEERRRDKRGLGFFLTREQIAAREGQPLSGLLRQASGVTVTRMRNGRHMLRFTRWTSKGAGCAPLVWLDGVPVKDFEIDDIQSSDVEAIELYGNAASAPPEFDAGGTFSCGVVAIWTRRPILKSR